MIEKSFVFNETELTDRINYILNKYGNDENVVIALNMIINHSKNINKADLTTAEVLLQNETYMLHKRQVEHLENLIQVKDEIIHEMADLILGKDYHENSLSIDRDDNHSVCIKQIIQHFEKKVEKFWENLKKVEKN